MAVGSWPRGTARCVLAQSRPFPTASLWGNVGVPGTGRPNASVSRVPPLWSPGGVHGSCWEDAALEVGPSIPLQTRQPGVGVGGFGGSWGAASGPTLTLLPFPCRAGDVCAFISNTRFSQAMRGTFPNVNHTLDNVHTYVASIPQARLVPLPQQGCLMAGKEAP